VLGGAPSFRLACISEGGLSYLSPKLPDTQIPGRCGTDEITPIAPSFRFIRSCFVCPASPVPHLQQPCRSIIIACAFRAERVSRSFWSIGLSLRGVISSVLKLPYGLPGDASKPPDLDKAGQDNSWGCDHDKFRLSTKLRVRANLPVRMTTKLDHKS
jgi:hypothetical protein